MYMTADVAVWTASIVEIPHIYIDTNIIVDVIGGKRRSSIHLMETIKEKKWKCSTSHFALMEALDVEKDNMFIFNKLKEGFTFKKILRKRSEKDLPKNDLENIYNKLYNSFFISYKFVQFFWLTKIGWEKAIELCRKTNISAPDIIHLATAIEAGCDILVTSDEIFCKNAIKFIPSSLPENFREELKKLNFKI